jgi:undecaprenyl-diphosphatase
MWEFLKSIILGVVEGLTEFLPISSTGHLILVNQWLSFSEDFTVLFDVFIQMGAILSVILFFRKTIFPAKFKMLFEQEFISFWMKIAIAFLPAAILGVLLSDFIEEKLFNITTVSIALFVGGILIILLDRKSRPFKFNSVKELPYLTAFFIGLFQCLSMVPGTSRSAATIIGALILGSSRILAAEFSFFLAIPTIIGASVYSLAKTKVDLSMQEIYLLMVGFIVSFIVALGVIQFLMNFIRKHSFVVFGYYRIVLALVLFIWIFLLK